MRVLVVEDDPKISDLIAEGHAVDVVVDGETGLQRALADSNGFDALILDLMLPKLDGFGVLAGLRGLGRMILVLMLSAKDSVDDRVRASSSLSLSTNSPPGCFP